MLRILYLGLNPPPSTPHQEIIPCPIIEPYAVDLSNEDKQLFRDQMPTITHLIFTSQQAVKFFIEFLRKERLDFMHLRHTLCITIGKQTDCAVHKAGFKQSIAATKETAEGIIELLKQLDLHNACIVYPHSIKSRPVIKYYLGQIGIRFLELALYNVKPCTPKISISFTEIDEIHFTSPSTIEAFISIYGQFPQGVKLTAIGPITQKSLVLNQEKAAKKEQIR